MSFSRIVDVCWERVAGDTSSIGMYQVEELIRELERLCPGLYTKEEKDVVRNMVTTTPRAKLRRAEAPRFLEKIAPGSLIRAKVESKGLLKSESRPLTRDRFLREPTYEARGYDARYSPKYGDSGYDTNLDRGFDAKLDRFGDLDRKFGDLDRKYGSDRLEPKYKRDDDPLGFGRLRSKPEPTKTDHSWFRLPDLTLSGVFKKADESPSDKDITIRRLRQMCTRYEDDIERYKQQARDHEQGLLQLKECLDRQEELTRQLAEKLHLEQPLASWVSRIPIVRHNWVYWKYRKEMQTWGMVVVNVVSIMMTAVVVLNVLRLVYFMARGVDTPMAYTYDEEVEIQPRIRWWERIAWLEYLIWSLS